MRNISVDIYPLSLKLKLYTPIYEYFLITFSKKLPNYLIQKNGIKMLVTAFSSKTIIQHTQIDIVIGSVLKYSRICLYNVFIIFSICWIFNNWIQNCHFRSLNRDYLLDILKEDNVASLERKKKGCSITHERFLINGENSNVYLTFLMHLFDILKTYHSNLN